MNTRITPALCHAPPPALRPLVASRVVDESDDRPLVIALCPDLMMRSRIESGLDVAGYRLRAVGGPTRLAEALAQEAPACILIDLEAGDDGEIGRAHV